MGARFDHLVVAVEDLDDAAVRWRAAGLHAARGGAHPVGTENVLVRGPGPAYVELIAAGRDETNPWLDRVRSARGPISWAIAVDDVDLARDALVGAGFEPRPVTEGSRRTPDGDVVAWRMCDVGPGPYDGSLPFLIEWTAPMAPGPADGPVVEWFELTPPDPDRLADLLLALGFEGRRHWPRRSFAPAGGVGITIHPLEEAVGQHEAAWSTSWEVAEPVASLVLAVPFGEPARHDLDGVAIATRPDRRRFAASALQPSYGHGSARERADAWIEAITDAGLGTGAPTDVEWASATTMEAVSAVRLRGPAGTQPITVVHASHPVEGDGFVVVGVGDPVEVLERQPELFSPGSPADEVGRIDDAFVLALSGGVYAVRGRRRSVTRHLDGSSSSGRFADGEAEQWLAQAAAGRRADGVVAGEPWIS